MGSTPRATFASNLISNEEEARLIGRVNEGHSEVFDDLLQPHLSVLGRLIRRKMRNDSEYEDVVQQTILKAFSGLSHFRFEASFRTWLVRIALNEVLQWRRSRARSRIHLVGEGGLALLPVADRTASPLNQCERNQTQGQLYRAIAQLPGKYQVVIRLRDLEGCTNTETARLLSLTEPSAKARHWRARLQLERLLSERL